MQQLIENRITMGTVPKTKKSFGNLYFKGIWKNERVIKLKNAFKRTSFGDCPPNEVKNMIHHKYSHIVVMIFARIVLGSKNHILFLQ